MFLSHHILVDIGCLLNFSLLGYLEVGFWRRYLILVPRHTPDTNLNTVVALAPAGNQIKFDLAGKLGLGQG